MKSHAMQYHPQTHCKFCWKYQCTVLARKSNNARNDGHPWMWQNIAVVRFNIHVTAIIFANIGMYIGEWGNRNKYGTPMSCTYVCSEDITCRGFMVTILFVLFIVQIIIWIFIFWKVFVVVIVIIIIIIIFICYWILQRHTNLDVTSLRNFKSHYWRLVW
jgi:hypothetical protein